MYMNMKLNISILVVALVLLSSCEQFLNVKPDSSLVVPSSGEDLRALLYDNSRMNGWYPSFQDGATDNQYLLPISWNNMTSLTAKNIYVWDDDLFNDSEINEWSMMYAAVYSCNLILEQLAKIDLPEKESQQIEGEALFFRAFSFYNLAQLWAKPFDEMTADADLGIPLRLKPDINQPIFRSTVRETYDQIISDLNLSAQLLSEKSEYRTTPTKQAVYGLLARIFLSMENYERALFYADSCLEFSNDLLNYSTLELGSPTSFPFPRYNDEVIYHATDFGRMIMNLTNGRIDNELYCTYADNDIRKTAFYRDVNGFFSFRGSYDGSSTLFTGISLNEIYLIKAESEIRLGERVASLHTLNKLLENRYDDTFIPRISNDDVEVLGIILEERRKELVYRGLRWSDLRRLNKDSRFAKTITRDIDGQIYKLEPNSPKYVLPIPNDVIKNTGIQQNDR